MKKKTPTIVRVWKKGLVYYQSSSEYGSIYDLAYNYYAVSDPIELAPKEWRISLENDLQELPH